MESIIAEFHTHSFEHWAALGAGMLSIITIAATGVWRAYTYSREQRQSEWKRIHELLVLLHNSDVKIGLWSQYAAVKELESFRRISRSTLVSLVDLIINHMKANPLAPAVEKLLPELESLRKRLDGTRAARSE